MKINMIADDSVSGAPSGFSAAVLSAAAEIGRAFSDNITVNLRYGWGSSYNVADPKEVTDTGAYALSNYSLPDWSNVRNWLTASSSTADDATAMAHLGGFSGSFYVTNAQEKAFGQISGTATGVDGSITFGQQSDPGFWHQAALHEIAHALGRNTENYSPNKSYATIFDAFRYGSVGTYQWTGGQPAYFSIDGGSTKLADFGTNSDYGDFLNSTTQRDPFAESGGAGSYQTLTELDLRTLDVIGFHRSEDYAQNDTTTGRLSTAGSGGLATGNLAAAGQRDWFRTTLNAGSVYVFDLEGYDTGQGSLPDPILRLYDSSSNYVTQNDDNGTNKNSRLSFTASTTGDYYLEAAGYNDTAANIGTFRLYGRVDQSPTITSSSSITMTEGTTDVVAVTASDPDSRSNPNTYTILGGVDSTLFSINSSTGQLSFKSAPDFENPISYYNSNSYHVTVQAADQFGATTYQNMTVNVVEGGESNERASINSNGGGDTATVSYPENGTTVTTVTGYDQVAGSTLIYSIAGGADAAKFGINSSNGNLFFNTPPDFENPSDASRSNSYVVQVKASTSDGFFDTQTLTVNVVERASITSNGGGDTATVSYPENGTTVTTVTGYDQVAGSTLIYSIAGGADAAKFGINSSNGNLFFNTPPDFENPSDASRSNSYVVQVKASTSDGFFDTQTLTVNVVERASITSNGGGDTATVSYPENGTTVTTVTGYDQVAGSTLIYSIAGGADAAKFGINSSNGNLFFNTPPDFEHPTDAAHNNAYVVQVRAATSDGFFDTQTLTVHVLDVEGTDPKRAQNDFNGDGTSDMLWQYKANSGVYDFTMSNGHVTASPLEATLTSTSWAFLGTGDFNGDGTSDFLEQYKATGGIYDFQMSNGQVTSSALVTTLPSSSWTFLGTGDFNSDGTSDSLFQYNTTGGVYDFAMNNGQLTSSAQVTTLPSSSWTFLGTGDFNGDGTSDQLWQYKATGGVYDFTMSNGQVTASPLVTTLPSSSWSYLGSGDFNGDGTSDMLWQYQPTGGIYDFQMSNGQVASSPLVTTLPANVWTFLGTGDFNGDGTSDFLMQYNATGGVYDFGMSNGQLTSSPLVTTLPASSWSHLA